MRVLLLNQAFYPDLVATAQYSWDLARTLTDRGHEVQVVASRRAYDEPTQRYTARESVRGIGIRRLEGTGFGKRSSLTRALDFGTFFALAAAQAIALPRIDVAVCLTSPPLIAAAGALRRLLRGTPLAYVVMDLNPDEAVAAGWLRPASVLGRLLEAVSRQTLRRSHATLVLDRFMKDRIVRKGIDPESVHVLPIWSHDQEVAYDAPGRERFRALHGLQDRFVVMYSGNHSPCHPLQTVLEAARQLSGDPRFAFCFVGGGSEWKKVRAFAEDHRLQNIRCLPYQPLDQLSASLSAADAHLVVMGDPFVGIVHPCKIYNVLQIGTPVLYVGPATSHVTEIFDQINDPDLCRSVRHGDPEGLVAHIHALASGPRRRGDAAYASVRAQHAAARVLPQWVELIERCGGGK